MPKSVNKVILLGNLGKDAETKFTPSGISVSKFSLGDQSSHERPAVRRMEGPYGLAQYFVFGGPKTSPISCSKANRFILRAVWKHAATKIKKGQKKYFTEVVCNAQDLVLLGGGARDSGESGGGDYDRPVSMPRSAQRPQAATSSAPPDDFGQGITDDDVPF